MSTTTLRELDGTFSINVPDEVVKELHLLPGPPLEVCVEGDHLVARPAHGRYSVARLLEEHAAVMEELRPDTEWVGAPAAGRELI